MDHSEKPKKQPEQVPRFGADLFGSTRDDDSSAALAISENKKSPAKSSSPTDSPLLPTEESSPQPASHIVTRTTLTKPELKETPIPQHNESKSAPKETSAQQPPIRTEQESSPSAKSQANDQPLVHPLPQPQRTLLNAGDHPNPPTDRQGMQKTQPLTVEQPASDVTRPAKPIEPSARALDTSKQLENSKSEIPRPPEISKSENQTQNGQSALKSLSVADFRSGSLVSLPIPEHRPDPMLPTKPVLEEIRTPANVETRPTAESVTSTRPLVSGAESTKPATARDSKVEPSQLDGNANAKVERTRLPQVPPTEGKIAESTKSKTDLTANVRSPFEGKIPEGKIADGKQADRVNDKTESNKAGKSEIKTDKADTKGDRITGSKGSGGSSGPSAFIQFIESQAGIRGGKPAADKSDNSEKASKSDKSDKSERAQKPESKLEPATIVDATKSGAGRTPASGIEGVKIAGVKLDGIKSSVDGLLGLVDTVKENVKSTFKGQGDRAAVNLKAGEFVAFPQKDLMPPLKNEIYSSAEIIAVLIPSHLVKWSIVRAPGIKPSDVSPRPQKNKSSRGPAVRAADQKPLSKSTEAKSPEIKSPEPKPFDINNPPDKSRPFIQLHGADSEYRAERPPVASRQPVVTPWLDVPDAIQKAHDDQSSTRPAVNPALTEKRRLVEAQEHTLPTVSEELSDEAKPLVATDLPAVNLSDRRTAYVNKEIDSQENTWSSDDEAKDPVRPMHRYAYVVRPGDTVESVAVAELNDLSLAPLLYGKNRKYVLPEVAYGVHPFLEGAVIDLPTPAEIAAFRQL